MNSSHKCARLFSQIGLNRTFLKQSSILWRCPTKVGDSALLRLFNGGSWCGVKTWSDEWLLWLNIDKCKTVSYYLKYPPLDTQYHIVDGNTTYILEKLNSINDFGVIFDSNLTLKDHVAQKINKAYSILGIIKRNFIHLDKSGFILLYKSMVRPHLEYANSVWCPYKQGDIKELEKSKKDLPNW